MLASLQPRLVFACAAICSATVGAGPALADPPADAVLVDGIALLAGSRPGDEGSATPVLISDVQLEAELLLVRRIGPQWRAAPRSAQLLIEARRVSALVTLLARQARQMGEELEPGAREAAREVLTDRAGGPAAMDELLERHGARPAHLERWLEDALLAAAQVRFLAERVEPVSSAELDALPIAADPAGDGQAASTVRERLRRELRDRQVARAVAVWLEGNLDRSLLRLLR